MYDYFFTFRSVTAAMNANEILSNAGIRGILSRTPKTLKQQGCSYSLRVRGDSPELTRRVLNRDGANYQRIYQKDGAGQWQEVAL